MNLQCIGAVGNRNMVAPRAPARYPTIPLVRSPSFLFRTIHNTPADSKAQPGQPAATWVTRSCEQAAVRVQHLIAHVCPRIPYRGIVPRPASADAFFGNTTAPMTWCRDPSALMANHVPCQTERNFRALLAVEYVRSNCVTAKALFGFDICSLRGQTTHR